MREEHVESYLKQRVEYHGGEVRKVQWVGRKNAPDRLILLPGPWCGATSSGGMWMSPRSVWVEVKRPGGRDTFPKDAHERAQHREHERLRSFGQRVEVVDSREGVDELITSILEVTHAR